MTSTGHLALGRWIRDRAAVTPARVAIEFAGKAWTYADLNARSEVAGARMLAGGLGPGDRVAVLAGNSAEYAALVFGCAKAGLIVVPLSWRLTAAELGYQIRDAAPGVLVHDSGQAGLAAAAAGEAAGGDGHQVRLTEMDDLVAGTAPEADSLGVAVGDDDGLFIVYTSGTTGRPKGAVLTHANCFWTNLSLDRTADITSTDVVLQVLPQFHIGGWNVQPLLAWWKGATVILEDSFDAGRALELITSRGVTTMMGVPANYLLMAEHPGFASADLSSLKYVLVGGAPMPEVLLRKWTERGVRIVQGYGLTEAAPNVLCLPAEDAARKLGYAGKGYPHVDVALGDPVSGKLIDGPGTGEVLVRGPNVFAGYWGNPQATADAMRGGWLHTGDIAERDDEGFYRLRDRLKDMYISGGENVYPAEVEAVLHEHPAVTEAAVIAVPDPRWGESGLAVVVLRGGAGASAADIQDFCSGRLAKFKVPAHVRFTEALPRSGMNKVLKTELRDRFIPKETS